LKNSLILRPRNLILGIGCRRGVSKERIANAVSEFLEYNRKSRLSVKCLATIELKRDEQGIIGFCNETGLPLNILPEEFIAANEGQFEASPFVREKVGVSSVAEPCAVLSGKNARLICGKTKYDGITLALAEEEKVLKL
jgi:cobalt-precorrin 5A hydrolase